MTLPNNNNIYSYIVYQSFLTSGDYDDEDAETPLADRLEAYKSTLCTY